MTVHAGDDAIYTPARGTAQRVRVWGHTPKRVGIVVGTDAGSGCFQLRYVKAERLERVPWGGAAKCR